MKEIAKKLLRLLLGDYSAYVIYANVSGKGDLQQTEPHTTLKVLSVDSTDIGACPEPLIREQIGYAGPGSHAYACFEQDRLVGVCFYWFGQRYLKRNYWPLQTGEAKLVQIITLPEVRGAGVATLLIAQSCHDMAARGFTKAFARVWHSNTPSIKAFERAGWTRIALVLEINPFRQSQPFRIRFKIRAHETRMQQS
ncbi:MAG: GNAT family N-acetyltransferase [Rhodoferax sp.]|nr:GNAT family N-acetyltransferase [Rhodoferax sp.]